MILTIKGDGFEKSQISPLFHSGLDPESSKFNHSWTPAGVYPGENRGRSDGIRTFYEFIKGNNED